MKEIGEEKALLAHEKQEEKVEHAADESHFHDEEWNIEHQDANVLKTAKAKDAAKLAHESKALAHGASVVTAVEAHEKKVLDEAHRKQKKAIHDEASILDKVIKIALKKKHEYVHEVNHLHEEEAHEKAHDKQEEIVD